MDNQALQQIKGIIDQHDTVSIVVGRNPHVDDMAAALSLYLTLQTAGKKVAVAAQSPVLVEHSSLVGIDKVTTSFETTGGDFVVSFPYVEEGEIEKVSYTLENGLLNIIVKPGEQGLSFTEKDVHFSHAGGVTGLVFTIGIPHVADIYPLISEENMKSATVINIDNKEQNENYGNVVLVSPRFSSVSEQVADLLLSLGYEFDQDTAQNLLNGISDATNNFQSTNTSYLAFEISAILLRKGAKRSVRPQQHQDRGGQNQQTRDNQQRPQGGNQQPRDNQPRPQQNQPRMDQSRRPQGGQGGNQQPRDNQPRPQQQGGQFNRSQHGPQPMNQQRSEQPIVSQRPEPSLPPRGEPVLQRSEPMHEEQPAQVITSPMIEDNNPPADWLTPKVYKGSTNV